MLYAQEEGRLRLPDYHRLVSHVPLPLSILLISFPYSYLEEMKDPVEISGEPDSILTDSIQSKGKGGRRGATHTLTHSYLAHNLWISGFLLVATAAEL